MEHASTVDIGARKRESGGINEDSIATAILENHHKKTGRPVGIFVLADGVGGEASGDVASFLATTIVRKRLTDLLGGPGTDVLDRFGIDAYGDRPPTADEAPEKILSTDRIREAIQEAIDEAHGAIQDYAREIGARPATTIVACVYADGKLHYGWVGDSRCYLLNTSQGTITQLTSDHALTNQLIEQGEIDHEEYARVHEDATAITNALGGSGHGKPTVDVEFGSAQVFAEDVIMLTSDGLIDAYPHVRPLREQYEAADDPGEALEEIRETLVTDDEILEIVLDAPDLRTAVEDLIDFANGRGGKDNLSITLARDRRAEPSPDSLPSRGSGVGTSEPTAVEEPDDADDEDQEVLPGSVDVVSLGGGGGPSAAVAVPTQETIYEFDGPVTLGRAEGEGDGPDIPLQVSEEAIVERTHAGVIYDDDADEWRVTDASSSGTYVEIEEGEWLLLLSSEGAELHRQHGFDLGEAAESDINETTALSDGMAFSLEDPRNDAARPCRFFTSLESAKESMRDGDIGEIHVSRFLV